jgi:hypothetical protein
MAASVIAYRAGSAKEISMTTVTIALQTLADTGLIDVVGD